MKKKRSGMTLVEVVIAMTLGLVILMFVGTFFRVNSEINATTYTKSELQGEAQVIKDKIMNFGMQAKGVEKVILEGGTSTNSNDNKVSTIYSNLSTPGVAPEIKEITITSVEEDSYGNVKDVKYTLKYNKNIKTLSLVKEGISDTILSENVENFEIKPGNENKSFEECSSIEINILLSHRKAQVKEEMAKVTCNTVVVFRNK